MTQSENTIYIRDDFDHNDPGFMDLCSICEDHNIKISLCSESPLYFHDSVLRFVGPDGQTFYNDWAFQYKKHIKNQYAITREPLAKALGIKGSNNLTILDATFGTGKDSVLLLSFGAKVIGFERNINIFAMGIDAKRIALNQQLDIFNNLIIYYGDSSSANFNDIDVIYFDPMYPEKKKSSLPRKEMQIFKEVVGPDEDFLERLNLFKSTGKKVILKRPLKSEVILKPSSSFRGKTTRYDLYLN